MRRYPVVAGKLYDEGFEKILMPGVRKATIEKDDDFLLGFVGVTGSGKSTLGFHALSLYTENPSIDFVALSRDRFARALKLASETKKPRYVDYDEADVIRRDAMTKWNKAIIKLYSKIRGKNIFHLWCHPSPQMIDRHQVEEVFNGLIFVYSKGSPRFYYYFTKRGLLRVLDKYGNLKGKTLTKAANEFAAWRGWFRKYDGPLWKDYLGLKRASMDETIDSFFKEWGVS